MDRSPNVATPVTAFWQTVPGSAELVEVPCSVPPFGLLSSPTVTGAVDVVTVLP